MAYILTAKRLLHNMQLDFIHMHHVSLIFEKNHGETQQNHIKHRVLVMQPLYIHLIMLL